MKGKQTRKWLRVGLYILAGALVGLLYYRFFGCNTVCPISSDPWRTMLTTGVIGFLVSIVMEPQNKEG